MMSWFGWDWQRQNRTQKKEKNAFWGKMTRKCFLEKNLMMSSHDGLREKKTLLIFAGPLTFTEKYLSHCKICIMSNIVFALKKVKDVEQIWELVFMAFFSSLLYMKFNPLQCAYIGFCAPMKRLFSSSLKDFKVGSILSI